MLLLRRQRRNEISLKHSDSFQGAAKAFAESVRQSESTTHGREGWPRGNDLSAHMLHGGQFRRGFLWYSSQGWRDGVRGASCFGQGGCGPRCHISRLDQIRRPEKGVRRKGEWSAHPVTLSDFYTCMHVITSVIIFSRALAPKWRSGWRSAFSPARPRRE